MSSSSYGPTSQGNNTTLSIPGNAYNVVIDVRGRHGASGGSDQNGDGGSGGKARKGQFTINDYVAVTLRSWKNTSGPDGGGSCTDTSGRSGGASGAGSGGTGGSQTGCSGGGGGGGGGAGVQVGSIWLIIAGGGGGGGGGSWDQSGNDGSNAGSFGGTSSAISPNGGGDGSSPGGDGGGGGGGGGGSSGGSGGSGGADQSSRSTGGGGGGSAYRSNLVSLISGTDAAHDGDSDVIISYDYKVAEIEYFRATPNPDSSSPYDVTLQWKIIDAPNGSASIDQSVGAVTLDSNGNSESSTTVSTGLSPSNEILTKTYTLTVTSADGTELSQSITVAVVDGSISTTHSTFFSSGSISFSELRTNFKESSSGQITASELLRNTNVLSTNPIVPDSTENADIGYSRTPNITGTTLPVNTTYTLNGTSYPVRGRLWVPTSLQDTSIDLVVAYHGTIGLDPSSGATTILDAADTNLTLLKGNEIGIDDKIIFSVAYPQDGITVAQNLNVLTVEQLSSFEFGDNLPYARAALLWAKNTLNSYMSTIGLSQRTNNVYMFGHSQGGSLVHKLNTLETTNGAVVNAPGPIRLDVTCENQENLGLVGPGKTLTPTNVTCQKLFNAYGSAASASEYQDVSLLYDYVTGHKATITYLQALDDPTGGTSGVGQVYWMGELTAAMSANGQSYNYITVPTGGHDAFYKPQNTTLHRAIRGVVGSYGVNLSISQFRNSIKYYNLKQVGGVIDLDIDSQNWNSNLNRNIVKEFELSGDCDSSDTYYYVSPHTAAAKFDNTSTYNLTILVSGSVKGSDGMNPIARSQNALSRTGSKLVTPNGNAGNAMEVDTTNGSIDINVSGSIIRGNKFNFGNFTDGAAITGTNYDVTILSGGSITGTFNAT